MVLFANCSELLTGPICPHSVMSDFAQTRETSPVTVENAELSGQPGRKHQMGDGERKRYDVPDGEDRSGVDRN